MREIKFRYALEVAITSKDDPAYHTWIETKIFSLDELERGQLQEWVKKEGYYIIRIIARDQFTGEKDRSGKEIYEGDVIGVKKRRNIKYEIIFDVKFGELELYAGQFGMGYSFPTPTVSDKYDYEQIGSIHENPELLNKK